MRTSQKIGFFIHNIIWDIKEISCTVLKFVIVLGIMLALCSIEGIVDLIVSAF